jgi:VCBS repeat protein
LECGYLFPLLVEITPIPSNRFVSKSRFTLFCGQTLNTLDKLRRRSWHNLPLCGRKLKQINGICCAPPDGQTAASEIKVNGHKHKFLSIIVLIFLSALAWRGKAIAAQLKLTWTDNSTNETGFKIERKTGASGTFVQIAVVGANVTSYTDSGISAGSYCYRVRAYNSYGDSPFIETCTNISANQTNVPPYQTYTISVDQNGQAELIISGTDNSFWGSQSTGTSFTSPEEWVQHGGEILGADAAQYADVNGDGKADLIYQGSDNSFWVSLSTGKSFTPPAWWIQHGGSFVAGQAQYADLNGDGKADLIFQGLDNAFWVSLSTGNGFTSPAWWIQHGGSFVAGQAQYADLNGDGKADLIFQGWDNTFWVSLSTGTGFTPPTLWADHGGSFVEGQAQYADLNGDGKADLIFQGLDNAFWVSLSTGNGFASPARWIQHGGSFVKGQAQYADLNGDGKADLIFQGLDNAFWVSLSTGTGFTPPTWWMQHGGSFVAGQAQYGDVNGDGKADLVFRGFDYSFWVSLSTGGSFTSPQVWLKF